jgi:hypothetical protein
MARITEEIHQQIGAEFVADANVQEKFDLPANADYNSSFSVVSLVRLIFYPVSYAIHVLERLFDTHKQEVSDYILRMKPHSAAWYVTVAKRFQYGYSLLPDSDLFDNGTHTEEEIESSKIVKYAAFIERGGRLQIKVAKQGGDGDLMPLESAEQTAFQSYLNRVRDAGVSISILTLPADSLKLEIDIYYNALIIDANGERIDGTAPTPVRDAIRNYLANIEFDGTFVLANLIDAIQQVEGVRFPYPRVVQTRYGALAWENVEAQYLPVSGYLRIADADLTLNYL